MYTLEKVELEQQEKDDLKAKLDSIVSNSDEWRQHARDRSDRARVFLKGGYDTVGDPEGYEDKTESDKPVLHLMQSRYAKIEAYMRDGEMPPEVIVEDLAESGNLGEGGESLLGDVAGQLQQILPDAGDPEFIAKIATARLDRCREKNDTDQFLGTVLKRAAFERVVGVKVGYDYNADSKEPAYACLIKAHHLIVDLESDSIMDGNYIGYMDPDVTVTQAAKEFNIDVEKLLGMIGDNDETSKQKDVPDEYKKIKLEYIWHKSDQMVSVTKETLATTDIMQMAVAEEMEVEKYDGGWQYTVRAAGKIIFNGHSPSHYGEPPVIIMAFDGYPAENDFQCFFDLFNGFVKNADALLNYSVKAQKAQLPKKYVAASDIHNPEVLLTNEVDDVVYVKTDGRPINQVVYDDAGGAPIVQMMQAHQSLVALGDDVIGTTGINLQDAGKNQSGDALEIIKEDHTGLVAHWQKNWLSFVKKFWCLTINTIIEFEDHDTTLTIIGANGQENKIALNVGMLSFDEYDFEAVFDVLVARPANMPASPIKRAAYIRDVFRSVVEMAQVNPLFARLWVEVSDLPHKSQMLDVIDQMQQQGDPASGEADAESQREMAKMQAEVVKQQAETRVKIAERAAQSVSDSYEAIAKGMASAGNFEGAAIMTDRIPAAVMDAFNQAMIVPPEAPQEGPPQGMPPQGPPMPPEGALPPAGPPMPPVGPNGQQ
jgi:hypothetical protein